MIVSTHAIPYKSGQTIRIRPIFDVHLGNKYCDLREFKKFISEDPEAYYFGGGDFFDSIIWPDKRYRKHTDDTVTNEITDELVDRGQEILEPIKNRILGLAHGNHEQTLTKYGTHLMKRLCKRLNVQHLGFSGLARLQLSDKGGRGRTVILRYHHGWGGGSRTQGADLTKYSKDMAYWDADIFCYGHVHRKQGDRVPRLGLVGNKLVSRPKLIGICGTFLRTYSNTADSTYSEEKGYPPVEIGGITINIKPDSHAWVDMKIDV